jgi:hypothetical protein
MSSNVSHDLPTNAIEPGNSALPEQAAEVKPIPPKPTAASATKARPRLPSQPWTDPVKPTGTTSNGPSSVPPPTTPAAASPAVPPVPVTTHSTAGGGAKRPVATISSSVPAVPAANPIVPLVETTDLEPLPFFEEWTTGRKGRMLQCASVSTLLHLLAVLLLALIHVAAMQTGGGSELIASSAEGTDGLQESLDSASLKIDTLEKVSTEMPAVSLVSAVDSDLAAAAPKISGTSEAVSLTSGVVTVDMIGGAGRSDDLGKMGKAAFFGSVSSGKRFIFVVDNSNSMKNGKFIKACQEMLESVSNLSPKQKFFVILFSDTSHIMFEPDPPSDLIPVDSATWAKLEKWVKEMPLYRGTNAKDSMRRALAYKPDAIYLLTDGMFTDDTEKYLLGLKDTSIPIHTIGFTSRKGEETLKRIAEKHGGKYTFVPK